MSFRGEEIAEAVRDIVVGGGDHDLVFEDVPRRVEHEVLGVTLTPEQRDLAHVAYLQCLMEVAFP